MQKQIDLLDANVIRLEYVWLSTTWSDLLLVTIGLLMRIAYTFFIANERIKKKQGVIFDARITWSENKWRWAMSSVIAYALIFATPEFLYDKFGYNWDTLLSICLGFFSISLLKYVIPKGDTIIRKYAEKGIKYDEKLHSNN